MGGIGFPELIIIFLVLLLVFGAKRIPEIARGIGKGIREFKSATNEISREIEAEDQERQINQPQSPQQGAPQPRQKQKQSQSAAPADASGEADPQQPDPVEPSSQDTEKAS
jgi:sec-independent protein translocase protein TatA